MVSNSNNTPESEEDTPQSHFQGVDTFNHDSAAMTSAGLPHSQAIDNYLVQQQNQRSEAFPVENWDRYRPVKFLGRGGMGKVFLADDLKLGRRVAIKFLSDDNPQVAKRFLQEARAQALIDHHRICKVFEVGEINGLLYIVMQYIDGEPFSNLTETLGFEEMALLMKGAAEGLQEAHRLGMIHRDIKPGNILMTRTEDGRPLSHVVDFGLVHHDEGTQLTKTGSVMGTPGYMAPEQAQGDLKGQDRRTDVYGLGATLYYLLTGRPPFQGSGVKVLQELLAGEPPKPRSIRADVPEELELIVLKCLEKDKNRRYSSARALAEELIRYLDGEPIQAKPAGLIYLTQKKYRKNKGVFLTAALASLLVFASLGWSGYSRWRASIREDLVVEFATRIQRIEALSRYAGMMPIHDIRPQRELIRKEIKWIEDQMQSAGDIALGPGHYALGCGFLVLKDHAAADKHLEYALELDSDNSQVISSLAQAKSGLYDAEMANLFLIGDEQERQVRRERAREKYLKPALEMAKKIRLSDNPETSFLEAKVAYLSERYGEALIKVDQLLRTRPWAYEALKLRGDIYSDQALPLIQRGETEAARTLFDEAVAAYDAAIAIGPSDLELYFSKALLARTFLEYEIHSGGEVNYFFEMARESLKNVTTIDPNHVDATVIFSQLHFGRAQRARGTDIDPMMDLETARKAVEKSLNSHPKLGLLLVEMGSIYFGMGLATMSERITSQAYYEKALSYMDLVQKKDMSYRYHNILGLICLALEKSAEGKAEFSVIHLKKAIKALESGIEIKPYIPSNHINLGRAYIRLSDKTNQKSHLENAKKSLEKARQINPKHIATLFYLARFHARIATSSFNRGMDASEYYRKSQDLLDNALEINPDHALLLDYKGLLLINQAENSWYHGRDTLSDLDTAIKALTRATDLRPKDGMKFNNLGLALSKKVKYNLKTQKQKELIDQALSMFKKAIELSPNHSHSWVQLGEAYLVQAYSSVSDRHIVEAIQNAKSALRYSGLTATDLDFAIASLKYAAFQIKNIEKNNVTMNTIYLEAEEVAKVGLEYHNNNQDLLLLSGIVNYRYATLQSKNNKSPNEWIQKAFTYFEKIPSKSRNQAEKHMYKALLYTLQSHSQETTANYDELIKSSYNLAINMNQNLDAQMSAELEALNYR